MPADPLLEVERLRVDFRTGDGTVHAVRDVSFRLHAGETLGIVGESGCGKSVTALSILRLLPEPPASVGVQSHIRFRGEDLLAASDRRMRELRGAGIGMIFQEPMTSLNPVLTIGDQVAETIRAHESGEGLAVRDRVLTLLERVGIPDPDVRYHAFPHQLSGGMRQRVMVAIALACGPDVLVADEPTTALDVTIQAQILDLLKELQADLGMGLLLISHDLAVVAQVADRVAVMYAGSIVDTGPAPDLFQQPGHPYTQGLLRALPSLDAPRGPLASMPGRVPDPRSTPVGCAFGPRCPHAWDRCREEAPPELAAPSGRARCWLHENGGLPEDAS